MTIGERIKNRREELGLTQDDLARKCGYKSRSSINKIELSRDLPLKKVSLMADALQTTPGYLMGWSEDIPLSHVSEDTDSSQLARAIDFYNKYKDAPPQIKTAIEALLNSEGE